MPELQTRTTSARQGPLANHLAIFGEKRPCTEPGCITRLNRYHCGDRCYVHEGDPRFRMVGPAEELRALMVEAKS